MDRRRFEHLVVELSVAIGCVVPRYPLWLQLQELGADPARLSRAQLIRFHDDHLTRFLAEHRMPPLTGRPACRLRRRLLRFDPRHPTPEETMQRLFSDPGDRRTGP